jgi:hypothetical protein
MRGFLNRVTRRSSTPATEVAAPPPPTTTAAATSVANESKDEIPLPTSTSSTKSNSSTKGIEPTPKADVALPKKNKRSPLVPLFPSPKFLPDELHLIEVRRCKH